ncbi:MAG: hypothetical protein U9N51_09040 [Bacteroidota bacterium]|nr:hypothetical protein [Bacteroidota bacterium]
MNIKQSLNNGFGYLQHLAHHRFNMKMGVIAGIITGSIVFYINYDFGILDAGFAFLKQFLFNFFMASYNIKLIERLVFRIRFKWLSILSGGLIPAIIATGIVFLVHWIGQTPEAWKSTYWQGFFNLPIFTITAWIYCSGAAEKYSFFKRILFTKTSKQQCGTKLTSKHPI